MSRTTDTNSAAPTSDERTPNLAERIARYAVGLRYEDLPAEVVRETKRRFIDSFATALGALQAGSEPGRVARAVAGRTSAAPPGRPASLIGGGSAAPDWAAFANGVLIRYLDYNDTYLSKEPAHPSDNIAAVLAAGEAVGAAGRDLIAATVLAYEVQCRLADAFSIRARGWDHVTYGAFSSAAAAGKLMGLDAGRMAHALNIAGVASAALRQTRAGELSMWKGCAFANAARHGVFAATLAADGMTGPSPIFEGEMGFFKQVCGGAAFDLPALDGPARHDGGAEPYMLLKSCIKFWPAEYHSQSAIEAALQLRPQVGDWRQIRSVDICSFDASVDIIGKDPEKWRPKTRETADHSLPYCTAVALADGDVSAAQFDAAHLNDPDLLALVGRTKVHRDAELTKRYPAGIPNRLVVTTGDGRTLTREVEFPRGHARNPMTDAEVEAKFRRLADGVIPRGRQDEALRRLWALEAETDIRGLLATVDGA
jgi:2-methylcitrate dehydratase